MSSKSSSSTLISDIDLFFRSRLKNMVIILAISCVFGCIVLIYLNFVMSSFPSFSKQSGLQPHSQHLNPGQSEALHEQTKLRLIFRTHADLADQLGVPQQDIILNEVISKFWMDTSLECPEPLFGKIKIGPEELSSASIQGWLITWKLGNVIYSYNTSVRGDWVLCSKIEIPSGISRYRSPSNR